MWKSDADNLTLSQGMPPMRGKQKKYNIRSDIKALLVKDCEVEKIIMFLKDLYLFEEI